MFGFEEIALRRLEGNAVAFADRFDDGARVNALVDVERDGGDFERGVLFLARPDELRIEMGVVIELFAGLDGGDRRMMLVGAVRRVGGSVSGVTSPTGGLLMRVLDL